MNSNIIMGDSIHCIDYIYLYLNMFTNMRKMGICNQEESENWEVSGKTLINYL